MAALLSRRMLPDGGGASTTKGLGKGRIDRRGGLPLPLEVVSSATWALTRGANAALLSTEEALSCLVASVLPMCKLVSLDSSMPPALLSPSSQSGSQSAKVI
jgi:hypothetical protein